MFLRFRCFVVFYLRKILTKIFEKFIKTQKIRMREILLILKQDRKTEKRFPLSSDYDILRFSGTSASIIC